jgi:hypothetical protein
MPEVHKLNMRPFEGISCGPCPEKLNPQNQARNTIMPFDMESNTGTSFRRRGRAEYCQPKKSRKRVAEMLHG